ncbi:uncharacterized protein LOC125203786 isoform X2 [Salvia hispanica]|uniref:uncharacterized protein LOC125203786 isoform X2 n=1 Tax=Salvia hispanica TaxID=49212 RepID=UPI002009657B|nr:uncharacterized protein LOC125203786 isoform X2 [Salvia hispanica]
MAMSRILSQSQSQSLTRASLRPSNALITHHRHRSTKPAHAQLIELDLDTASPSQPSIKSLGDAIHSIIVRRAAPDWLPFLPGHSYWVPSAGMIQALHRLTSSEAEPATLHHELLSEDEQMSLLSAKGWPSSTYFIGGLPSLQIWKAWKRSRWKATLKEEEAD